MIKPLIHDEALDKISNVIALRLGLNFPPERWADLERSLITTLNQTNLSSNEFISLLTNNSLSRKQLDILAGNLTIGETYFFRDKKFYEALEETILPDLINSRRKNDYYLRVWCAGCATGEEPYSISILLHKLLPDINQWKITLLATDINPHFLRKMEAGIYNEWSFRDVPDSIIQKYFVKTPNSHYKSEGSFRILDHIKKIVTPAYLNLAEDCYPSLLNNTNAMDIIICRNVLMYFTPGNSKKVVQCFYRSLIENGWLIVSPSETSQIQFNQYSMVNLHNEIFYQKDSHSKVSDALPEVSLLNYHDVYEQIPETLPELEASFLTTEEIPQPINTPGKIHRTQSVTYQEVQTLFERGEYIEAKKSLMQYFQDNYNDPDAHSLLARIHANEGNLREAFAWCGKAVSLDRMNPSHHYLMASILQEQNKFEGAITSIKRALYLDPNFVPGYFTLGNIYAKLGSVKESKKNFNNALQLLRKYQPDEVFKEADGMTAKRLIEIIHSTLDVEVEQ